jgi:hypothetical protein
MAAKKSGGAKRGSGGKQTSDRISSLASDVLAGRKKPTPKEVRSLAGSALSSDETKGKRGKK